MNANDSQWFYVVVGVGMLFLVAAWMLLPFLLLEALARIRRELEAVNKTLLSTPDISQITKAVDELREINMHLSSLRVAAASEP